ncbi:BTB and MATH domain-containing protein 43-like [Venturia canescens]|uniref:BTB and MATH domain-containing protein 43-like n=1 Tax=Venturia canescens TaxID=32260 RepID=UPI001C9C17E6|nr:BTB and MATH domain-containing protein 43-like [Venturia canescens]
MADNVQWQERIGAEKHVTEFEWILHDWSLLYGAKYSKGVESGAFKVNGTNGCTCTLLINSKEPYLTMTFSCTENILAMRVNCHVSRAHPYKNNYSAPFTKNSFPIYLRCEGFTQTSYRMAATHGDENDTFIVSLKISIVTPVDIITISTNKKGDTNKQLFKNSVEPSTHILANFKALLNSKSLSDTTLVLGDKKYSAHKTILAAQSKVFERMFETGMKEQKKKDVKVIDTDAEVFVKFLSYLYTGELTDLEKMVEKMIVLADYYEVDHLKTTCENLMLANLCEKNSVQYVILASELCCSALKNKALEMIRNNRTILETVLEENHETLSRLKQILSKNLVKK